MTQNEFFNTLMDGLKDFPETKLQYIISYYEHSFTLGLDAGKTEEEIIQELGDPNSIVNKCRNEDLSISVDTKSFVNNNAANINNNDSNFNEIPKENVSNHSNDRYNDFNTSDSAKNNYSTNEFDFKNTSESNYSELTHSHDNTNSDNDFYELHSSNISSDNKECDSQPVTPEMLSSNFNNNKNFTSENYNKSNSKYKSNAFSNNFANQNYSSKSSQVNVNVILQICIIFLAIIIFFPVITGVIGFFIGLFGIAVSIFVASIGVLVGGTFTSIIGLPNMPAFVANFPYPVIVLFSLGSISLSILLTLLFYYLCKFFIRIIIKIYNLLKIKGGVF